MKVDGQPTRTIWLEPDGWTVSAIDQRRLPHEFIIATLTSLEAAAESIRSMLVRGAPLIGATAAYGMALAMHADASDAALDARLRHAARHAADRDQSEMGARRDALACCSRCRRPSARAAAYARAAEIADEDVAINQSIGRHGLALIEAIARQEEAGRARQRAHPLQRRLARHRRLGHRDRADLSWRIDAGLAIHVWVDETRPRNQGASLTAWELGHHGVPHTVIPDNTGGHLMQHGMVDLCIVGTDRVTASGDVCNKIGTYLKALAANDNDVPFYVALPSPTIDFSIDDGVREIPIEQRDADEVTHDDRAHADGRIETVRIVPKARRWRITASTSRRRGWSPG